MQYLSDLTHEKPLCRAVRALMLGAAIGAPLVATLAATPAFAQTQNEQRNYAIAAGPLEPAIAQFSAAAGVTVSFTPELAKGRTTKGLNGRYGVEQGLAALLAGTGLQALSSGSSGFVLKQLPLGDAVTLPKMKISADQHEIATGPVIGYVANRSATATKSDVPINAIPQSISVVTHDQIQDQGVVAVQESLRYSAGVSTDLYGSRNTTEYFLIRGSKPTTLLNGLRQGQQWFAEPLDVVYGFERIEVLRGPNAIVAGPTGPGGIVNLVSKRPLAEAQREISAQLGNDERKQLAFDATGPLNNDGSLLYRIVGVTLDTDTQVDYADYKRNFIAPSLTWLPSEVTSVTFFAEYQRDENGNNDAFLPVVGTLEAGPHGKIPIERFISEPGWDGNTGERVRVGYEIEQALADDWRLRHNLRHDDSDRELKSMYTWWWEGYTDASGNADSNGRYLRRSWAINEGSTTSLAADLLLEGKFSTGPLQHTLVTGTDLLRYRRRDRYFEDEATPLDMFTPTYGSFRPPSSLDGMGIAETKPHVEQLGFLAIDHIRIDRWALTLGLRYDDVESESGDDRQRVDAWTNNAGIVYLADGGFSPYLSYSESFEAQGASTSGRVFAPKRGEQYETGLKWQPSSNLRATASVFRLEEQNRLKSDPNNPLGQIESDPVQIQGVEFEAEANIGKWDLIAAYTRLSAKDEESGTRVAFVAETTTSAWIQRRFAAFGVQGLIAGIGARHVGETSNGNDTVTVPSVTLGDAMVAWESNAWRLGLNVTNLNDKEFVSTCDPSEYCWYGAGRKIISSATYRW